MTEAHGQLCGGPACPLWGGQPGGCLRRIGIFRNVTDSQAQSLRRTAQPVAAVPEERLFAAGEPARKITLVVRGLVKVFRSDSEGREHIIRLLMSGEHFGSEFLFADETLRVSGQAITESQVCFVSIDAVEALLAADASLASRIISAMARNIRQAEDNVVRMAFADARQRLASLLLDLGEAVGRQAGPDRAHLQLPLSRAELAALVGIAQETASRRLSELAAQGLITVHGHRGLTIESKSRLREVAGRPPVH